MKRYLLALAFIALFGMIIVSGLRAQPFIYDSWLTGGPNADPVRLENGDVIHLSDQRINRAVVWLHVSSDTVTTTVHVFTPSSRHYRVQGEPSQICYDERCEIFSESGTYVLLAQPVGLGSEVGPYFARVFELITPEETARARQSVDVGSTNIDVLPNSGGGGQGSDTTAQPEGTTVRAGEVEEEEEGLALPAGSGTVIEHWVKSWLEVYWTRWPAGTETHYAKRPGDTAWTRTQCLGTYDDYPNVDHPHCDYWAEFIRDDNYTQSGARCVDNPGQTVSVLFRTGGNTVRLQVKCP